MQQDWLVREPPETCLCLRNPGISGRQHHAQFISHECRRSEPSSPCYLPRLFKSHEEAVSYGNLQSQERRSKVTELSLSFLCRTRVTLLEGQPWGVTFNICLPPTHCLHRSGSQPTSAWFWGSSPAPRVLDVNREY